MSPIAVATRLAAPCSTRKMTQPPPPAPQALAALSAVPGGNADQFVDERRGDSRSVAAAQLPFLAEQARHLVPLGIGQRLVHGAGDFNDAFEVAEHPLVAIDVGLENFPIVDTGLARRAGVGQNKARLDFFRGDRDRLAMNAVRIEMDRARPSIKRGIVILAAGRDLDDLRLDVLGNHPHLLQA